MATASFTVAPTNTDDASFRAWSAAIDTAITGVGWVDTAATGEINFTTVTKPGSANTFAGFKVYRMADALQATHPCFLKIEFGSSNTSANNPAVKLTVGTAHDGSGSLTGTQSTGALQTGSQAASATLCQCYASGTTGRLSLAMFVENSTVNSQLAFVFGVERTKAADGSDNSDGLVLAACGFGSVSNGPTGIFTVVVPASGGMPPRELRWAIPFSRNSVGASTFNSVEGMGLLVPFLGAALRPVMNWGAMNTTDAPIYTSSITPTVYGGSHTYISLGTAQSLNAPYESPASLSGAVNVMRMLMRYE